MSDINWIPFTEDPTGRIRVEHDPLNDYYRVWEDQRVMAFFSSVEVLEKALRGKVSHKFLSESSPAEYNPRDYDSRYISQN